MFCVKGIGFGVDGYLFSVKCFFDLGFELFVGCYGFIVFMVDGG